MRLSSLVCKAASDVIPRTTASTLVLFYLAGLTPLYHPVAFAARLRRAAKAPFAANTFPNLPHGKWKAYSRNAVLADSAPAVLLYRGAPQPMSDHNAVAFWLKGDSRPGSIVCYLMASKGRANDPRSVQGSGDETEPLWPAWISPQISTNYAGWKRILEPQSAFSYRAPVDAVATDPPASFSAVDSIGFSSAKRSGTLAVDDVVWADDDTSGNAVGNSVTVDNFESGNVSAWQPIGTPESVGGLYTSVTSDRSYVKQGRAALKLVYSLASDRRAAQQNTVDRIIQQTGSPVLVYVPASPFDRQLPDSLPSLNEISNQVSVTVCPDQVQAASFCLYSVTPLTNVTVRPQFDLQGIGRVIPRRAIDIRVVDVWKQMGTTVLRDPDGQGLTPELLVKDDRVPIDMAGGVPPTVRLTGDPITTIRPYTQKQFWITVTVPRYTAGGDYTTQLVVRSSQLPPFSVSLDVNVLPLKLLSPAKQYVLGFRGKVGNEPDVLAEDHITQSELYAQLADITGHGIHYLSVSDEPASLAQSVAACSAFNLQMPLVYSGLDCPDCVARAEDVDKMASANSSFTYLVPNGPDQLSDLAQLKKAGLTTAAMITPESDFESMKDNLDVPIYQVDTAYPQQLLATHGKRQSDKRDWWTWPSGQINPQDERLFSGYLLWRSDLYGAYISDYETWYGSDPYDDTQPGTLPGTAALRPAMLTYPVNGGVLDTIQWEAVREGIDDVRYLTTYYTAMRECKDAHIDKPLIDKSQAAVLAFLNSSFWLMKDADYQRGRLMIAGYALKLRQDADSLGRRHA